MLCQAGLECAPGIANGVCGREEYQTKGFATWLIQTFCGARSAATAGAVTVCCSMLHSNVHATDFSRLLDENP